MSFSHSFSCGSLVERFSELVKSKRNEDMLKGKAEWDCQEERNGGEGDLGYAEEAELLGDGHGLASNVPVGTLQQDRNL